MLHHPQVKLEPMVARASIWRRGGDGACGPPTTLHPGDSQHAKVSSDCGGSAQAATGGGGGTGDQVGPQPPYHVRSHTWLLTSALDPGSEASAIAPTSTVEARWPA